MIPDVIIFFITFFAFLVTFVAIVSEGFFELNDYNGLFGFLTIISFLILPTLSIIIATQEYELESVHVSDVHVIPSDIFDEYYYKDHENEMVRLSKIPKDGNVVKTEYYKKRDFLFVLSTFDYTNTTITPDDTAK